MTTTYEMRVKYEAGWGDWGFVYPTGWVREALESSHITHITLHSTNAPKKRQWRRAA